MTSIDVNALKSLLPQAVIQFALQHADSEPPLKQPFTTVALFADVSGFTKLSEAFASKGPQGAEELAFFLNRYMEQLVRHIARAGGDVFKFAGDAMLVLWVPPGDLDEDGIQKEIRNMAHRAVQTSIAIQNELHSADLTDGVTLSVKIGIGVGNATVLHVGGVYSRVEYFACGIPLMQAFKSEEHATQGDIIVSPDVWKIIEDSFTGDIFDDNYVRITRQTQAVRNKSVKAGNSKYLQADVHELQKLLAKYIPAAVLPYLTRCQNSWSGELRLVTVLFVNVGVNLSNVQTIDHTSLAWIQQVITGIQKAIYRYEGSLNKFLVDDKGSNVIAVFGVPPLAHNDDATRGLLAALKLLRKMHGLGIKCYIGVTSGLVYTGLLGSGTSREYGVLGDAVNLAARLMAKQKKCGVPGVICDTTTQELIPSDAPIRFDSLEPFHVKGKMQLIKAFSPKYTENILAYKPQSHYYNIGRESYINLIEKWFKKESSFVSLIESPIGSGKTFYMESIVNSVLPKLNDEDMKTDEDANSSRNNSVSRSNSNSNINNNIMSNINNSNNNSNSNSSNGCCRIIWASGHHYVQSKNINIWLFIFGALLSRSNFTENRSYRQHVKTIFVNSGHSELVPYLALANDVFGTQFLETEKCNHLPEEHRWDKKTECCLALLEYFSIKQKLVICIDNLQWSVVADWKITEFVVNMITTSDALNSVYVFLSSRPLLSILYRPRFEAPPEQYGRIRKLLKSHKQLMALRTWDLTEVTTFMCEYFAVDDVHPCLPHFVYERSGGNPAFVEWISELIDVHVTYCDDVLLLEMTDKTAQSITSEAPLQHPVPIKVHSVLMGYIDRLTPSQILMLKTAAAICMGQGSGSVVFDQQSVLDCYPVTEYKDAIPSDLQHLCNIGIVRRIENGVLNYDIFSSSPNFFVHNHQWMQSATFVSLILEVSFNKKRSSLLDKKKSGAIKKDEGDNKNFIFSQKLLHFFVNRLVFYSFDPQKGVSWRLKQIIAFNDPEKPIRLKRASKEILVVENNECLVQIRSKAARLDELHRTFDDALTSRGVMTQPQERDTTYPALPRSAHNQLYAFKCGFFRDVIYGLMLLKQRQQLHDNAAKFLGQRWTNSEEESEAEEEDQEQEPAPENEHKNENEEQVEENEHKLSVIVSENEESETETVGLKRTIHDVSSVSSFTQIFRSKVLARHRDLALKDDTLRRMGSFYQAAPQANTAHDKSKRLQSITSFYTKIRSKGQDKNRIATLSPKNFRRPSTTPSIFSKLRQSLSPRMD